MTRFLNGVARMLGALRGPAPAAEVRPMYNLERSADGASAEMVLYGDVLERPHEDWWTGEVDDWCISTKQVVEDLKELDGVDELTIRLNSCGGEVFAGIAIHNMLKSLAAHKTVVVEGLAASAASVIMCAGDTVKVHPGSMVMIHRVSGLLFGFYNTDELEEVVKDLAAPEKSLRAIYTARTGKSDEEVAAIMADTTWYVGQEAVDAGFADEVVGFDGGEGPAAPALDAAGGFLMVAGVRHPVDRLPNLPGWIAGRDTAPIAAAAARAYPSAAGDEPGGEEKEEELEINNLGELRAAYPDLVAEAEASAAASERERIKGIEAIAASVASAEMVAAAKFDEPKTAAELALEAVSASAAAGTKFLADAKADAEESGAAAVDADPAETDEDDEDKKDEEELQNALAMYNSIKKKGGR